MKSTVKLTLLAVILSVSACVTPSQITYIKDMEYGRDYPAKPAPELHVQKQDRLTIHVYSSDPALATPFNVGALTQDGVGGTREASYIVDADGNIDFPVLGTIPVEGMTLKEVQMNITNRIINSGYIHPEARQIADSLVGRLGVGVVVSGCWILLKLHKHV